MEYYEVIVRLLIAVIVGGSIGYEREFKNRPAGFRTHILVCVGAAIISMIQINMIEDTKRIIIEYPILQAALKADVGRMGAQVITGVGFLGTGTIIHEKGLVKGLTTAASIWVVACIGLGVGLGYYFLSITAAVVVFISLVVLKRVEDKLVLRFTIIEIQIEYCNRKDFIKQVQKYFEKKNIEVENIEFVDSEEEIERKQKTSIYTLLVPKYLKTTNIIQEICKLESVGKATLM